LLIKYLYSYSSSKFPTLVPLAKGKPTDGTSPIEAFKNEMTPGLIQNFRYHLSNAYEQLDKIKLDREQQKVWNNSLILSHKLPLSHFTVDCRDIHGHSRAAEHRGALSFSSFVGTYPVSFIH
jgi:hypothetical protein